MNDDFHARAVSALKDTGNLLDEAIANEQSAQAALDEHKAKELPRGMVFQQLVVDYHQAKRRVVHFRHIYNTLLVLFDPTFKPEPIEDDE
jgi:hypothetical protein